MRGEKSVGRGRKRWQAGGENKEQIVEGRWQMAGKGRGDG
jgi:hypothetical protein